MDYHTQQHTNKQIHTRTRIRTNTHIQTEFPNTLRNTHVCTVCGLLQYNKSLFWPTPSLFHLLPLNFTCPISFFLIPALPRASPPSVPFSLPLSSPELPFPLIWSVPLSLLTSSVPQCPPLTPPLPLSLTLSSVFCLFLPCVFSPPYMLCVSDCLFNLPPPRY